MEIWRLATCGHGLHCFSKSRKVENTFDNSEVGGLSKILVIHACYSDGPKVLKLTLTLLTLALLTLTVAIYSGHVTDFGSRYNHVVCQPRCIVINQYKVTTC